MDMHVFKEVAAASGQFKTGHLLVPRPHLPSPIALGARAGAPWSVQDNSSMSCKEIVIRVTMPDTKFSTVSLLSIDQPVAGKMRAAVQPGGVASAVSSSGTKRPSVRCCTESY